MEGIRSGRDNSLRHLEHLDSGLSLLRTHHSDSTLRVGFDVARRLAVVVVVCLQVVADKTDPAFEWEIDSKHNVYAFFRAVFQVPSVEPMLSKFKSTYLQGLSETLQFVQGKRFSERSHLICPTRYVSVVAASRGPRGYNLFFVTNLASIS